MDELVADRRKALALYEDVLGFRLKTGMSHGDQCWLTVVSPSALSDASAGQGPIWRARHAQPVPGR